MRFEVEASEGRLDSFVAKRITDYSRSYLSQLINDGLITVNGNKSKASYKVGCGDVIEVTIPEPINTDAKPEEIPLNIVYEDSDLLIINKPQGMVVHPACGHHEGTLVNALLSHCGEDLSDINGVIRPGIVHRIDKDTSGLMVVCKNNETHLKLADMLSRHEIKRQYRTVVYGVVGPDKGTINAPIGRSSTDRRKMTVTEEGKPSVTHFEVVKRYRNVTDLKVDLETGRTHQIRAHMTYIGHPVVGDPLYASKKPKYGMIGQVLHSQTISFVHPRTGEEIYFTSELPDYYVRLLEGLDEL